MSDRIKELVQTVKNKANDLHSKVQMERSKNQDLENNLDRLRSELKDKESEVLKLQQEISQYEAKIKAQNEVSVADQKSERISDTEIDELVREIDYCIAQLKR